MIFLVSCDVSHDPYLKHKVKLTKISEDCSARSDMFSMNSNTNGERYVFQECLDAGGDIKNVLIERKGDTVSIQFKKNSSQQHLFELTVDINTKPQYNWLVVGNNTIAILPAGN